MKYARAASLARRAKKTLTDDLSSDKDEVGDSIYGNVCKMVGSAVICGKTSSGHHVSK